MNPVRTLRRDGLAKACRLGHRRGTSADRTLLRDVNGGLRRLLRGFVNAVLLHIDPAFRGQVHTKGANPAGRRQPESSRFRALRPRRTGSALPAGAGFPVVALIRGQAPGWIGRRPRSPSLPSSIHEDAFGVVLPEHVVANLPERRAIKEVRDRANQCGQADRDCAGPSAGAGKAIPDRTLEVDFECCLPADAGEACEGYEHVERYRRPLAAQTPEQVLVDRLFRPDRVAVSWVLAGEDCFSRRARTQKVKAIKDVRVSKAVVAKHLRERVLGGQHQREAGKRPLVCDEFRPLRQVSLSQASKRVLGLELLLFPENPFDYDIADSQVMPATRRTGKLGVQPRDAELLQEIDAGSVVNALLPHREPRKVPANFPSDDRGSAWLWCPTALGSTKLHKPAHVAIGP